MWQYIERVELVGGSGIFSRASSISLLVLLYFCGGDNVTHISSIFTRLYASVLKGTWVNLVDIHTYYI